jgi:hypothetical protein
MPDLPPDLAALTAALGGLAPATSLNRDRLLYEAGRRAAVRGRRPWQLVAGVFAALTVMLGVRMATEPIPAPQVQIVYDSRPNPEPQAPAMVASGSPQNEEWPISTTASAAPYLRLRDQVVRFGADSLPAALPAAVAPLPPVEMWLGLPAGSLDDAHKSRWQHQLLQGDV